MMLIAVLVALVCSGVAAWCMLFAVLVALVCSGVAAW